ncbi:MAG TPA: hypothetical protein VGA50_16690 [Kiloniellales bacterium]
MSTRFVVVDQGLNTGVYRIHTHQTARLLNEFGNENIEIFDSFEDAREAALLIIGRCDEAWKQSQWRFAFRSDPQIERLKREFSELTADGVETFFV